MKEYEGLSVIKCFPDSFERAASQNQMGEEPTAAEVAAWENYNIGIETTRPFALLLFQDKGDYEAAKVKEPALDPLTAVLNPDGSVAVWFSWPRWGSGYNGYLNDLTCRLICRHYIAPAPPSNVGESQTTFIKKAKPILLDWDPDPSSAKAMNVKPFSLQAVSLQGMMAFSPPEVPVYISGGVLDGEGKLMIAGEPKIGKSRLAMNLAFSLVTGRPFLGFQTMGFPRVLFVQFEVTKWRFQQRVTSISRAWKIPVDTSLPLFFVTIKSLHLDNQHSLADLRRLIRTFKAEVVFLDPFAKIHGSNEREGQDMQGLLDTLDELIDDLGISLVLVHHVRKPGSDGGPTWARIRGHSGIPGWADSMLVLEKPTREAKPIVEAILRNGEDWRKAIKFKDDHTVEVIGDVMSAIELSIQESFLVDPTSSRKDLATRASKQYNVDILEIYGIMRGMESKGIGLPK